MQHEQQLSIKILEQLEKLGLPQDCEGFNVPRTGSGGGISDTSRLIRHPTYDVLEDWLEELIIEEVGDYKSYTIKNTHTLRNVHNKKPKHPYKAELSVIFLSGDRIHKSNRPNGSGKNKTEALAKLIMHIHTLK